MWLTLDLNEKTDLKILRDGSIIQVFIDRKDRREPYTANARVLKVVHFPQKIRKQARIQIDITNPLDKKMS